MLKSKKIKKFSKKSKKNRDYKINKKYNKKNKTKKNKLRKNSRKRLYNQRAGVKRSKGVKKPTGVKKTVTANIPEYRSMRDEMYLEGDYYDYEKHSRGHNVDNRNVSSYMNPEDFLENQSLLEKQRFEKQRFYDEELLDTDMRRANLAMEAANELKVAARSRNRNINEIDDEIDHVAIRDYLTGIHLRRPTDKELTNYINNEVLDDPVPNKRVKYNPEIGLELI